MAKSKAGRNKDKCQAYRANGTRDKNKKLRAERRIAKLAKNAIKRRNREQIREMVRADIEEPI